MINIIPQLSSTATEQAEQSSEYFILLTRLLSYAAASNLSLSTAESLLNTEITWLKKIRENVRKTGSAGCHENLLEGKFTFTNHRWRCCLIQIFWHLHFDLKVENILKSILDSIPSPSALVKIQNMGGKVC